ncbi:helix-turn-helix domain-containing protein [Streptomyces violascens]|uniref:Transcriptional regulator n=1 Tax=Streptomyces violascens TaxID=67381 RepID=A0ABQ3QEE2_9ACTN|nr:helix-turn-helix transcriptional regulator [Streptomyces violascens]GGU01116.1 transcriptional regulator [Streptomyces violascens]GHI35615.1 transcriptional regulator [Streptomyces violascens]
MARAENKVTAGPTAQMVANLARKLRVRKGWTQEQLGSELGFSGAAVSAMETLAQPASDDMLVQLERVLGDGMDIFEDARVPVRLEKFPEQFKDYSLLEQQALVLRLYATLVIHGLFQTEEYARALIGGGYPPLPEQRVEELVEARMARRALFDRTPVALIEVVLEESVLRRAIGSKEVMRGQMLHLAECARRRNVTFQVLPMECGLSGEHAGARGGMTLAETPEHDHLVYLEPQDESLLISAPAKVSTYAQRYAKIRAQALDPRASLGLIEELAGEHR